jgi:uncharacterized protein (TIGR03790 family)
MRFFSLAASSLMLLVLACPAVALKPADVFLVANKNVAASQEVADHYCAKRGVPHEHIIVLDLPTGEDISRREYDTRLVRPLRAALAKRRDEVKVLLTVYGVPLRVGREEPTAEERKELDRLKPLIEQQQSQVKKLQEEITRLEAEKKKEPSGAAAQKLAQRQKERDGLQGKLRSLEARRRAAEHAESEACVDSELSLLWWESYELRRWQMNLLYFQVPEKLRKEKPPVVMVCRLDGPTPAIARRLVDDAVAVEQKGLTGKAYFDARGIKYDPTHDSGTGYGGYDESLREAARLLGEQGKLPVTLDDKPELFAPGSCPDCALYCGWYSLANYVDCCRFVPGAVAYHIASSEAVSLRNANSKLWCPCLLQKGVAATLGPVAEPYTVGFPKPAEFFGFLATGRFCLVECYYRTALFNSWMTVLVGDPLYNPFAKNPRLTLEQVKPSPQGGKPLIRGRNG